MTAKKTMAFIGSYAEADGPGLYACAYDAANGTLHLTDRVSGLQNPTFLAVEPAAGRLYASEDVVEPAGKRGGAAAFAIDPARGALRLLNRETTVSSTTCHISLDRTGRAVFTASYHGGFIGVSPVLEDGRIGPLAQEVRHTGASVLPVQQQARVHSATIDRTGRHAVVCDLGLDKIFVYRFDPQGPALVPHSETATAPGSGPRHFAFHPELPFGYVINELNSTIIAYRYDEAEGRLAEIGTVPTLPDDYKGDNATADIHVSSDGRHLYGSNRGHDSIAIYAIDAATGKPSPIGHVPSGGGHPRNFAISPDGRFVVVANRDGNSLVTFARDADTGSLRPTGAVLEVSKPVCVAFAEFPG